MKITDLQLREIRAEIPVVTGGTYQLSTRRAILCRISTDEGLVSEVCVGNESAYADALKQFIRGPARERILGASPLETMGIWRCLFAGATGTDRPYAMRALSMIDICLWDLKGKVTGQPIWKLIGGANRRVPIIGIGGYYESSGDEAGIRMEMTALKRQGLGGVKFKVGARSLEEDADRVRIAREASGSEFALVVDSNTAWTPRDAVRFADMISPYRPAWLEEPVRWQNMYRGLREVRFKSSVRIAAGQSEVSVFDCYSLLSGEAVDVINVSVSRGGGITGWTMLAGAAAMADVDMAQVAEPHIGMHLMAGIANPTYVECYGDAQRDPFWANLYTDRPEAVGGFIEAPERPGLGLTFNTDVVERFAIEKWH